MVPPSRPADAEPLPADLGHATPEQQLTQALACFQAEVSPIAAIDLAEVVHAARPAFRSGIGWSAHLREQQGRSRLQVTVMHVAGAELCSESWADEVSDLAETIGLMLAMLLGIPVSSSARAIQPCCTDSEQSEDKPDEGMARQACPDQEAVDPVPADGDPGLAPLTPEQVSEVHRRVLELPQATRQELTKAFREHFQVPRNARSIGDRITQRLHSDFIELFLAEAQGQVQAEAPAEPGP
jgi:hypothetical protein